jgi:hypothetical protein
MNIKILALILSAFAAISCHKEKELPVTRTDAIAIKTEKVSVELCTTGTVGRDNNV